MKSVKDKIKKDSGVFLARNVMESNYTDKYTQDTINQAINIAYKAASTVVVPTPPNYIGAKKLYQSIWKTTNRTKPLDFEMHGTAIEEDQTIDETVEQLVTEGFATVLKRANYDATFRDKGGMASNLLMYGDGFRMIGRRGEGGFPIEFINITNNNLYVSVQSTGFRRGNKPVTEAVAVFSGTKDEFLALFPTMKSKASQIYGTIPRTQVQIKDLDQTSTQVFNGGSGENDIVEWAYYFNKVKKIYTLFVGGNCLVVEEKTGNDYPYVFTDAEGREQTYIPISQYICVPAAEGFYNIGLGALLYDLTIADAETLNDMVGSIKENTYPLTFTNVPEALVDSFGQLLEMGYRMRKAGQRAIVPLPQGPGGTSYSPAQPLQNAGDINGASILRGAYDLEFKRMGVHLDEPEAADATATQTLRDEQNANAFVQNFMEYNASETEFELYVVLDLIKKLVKKSDKTPLNIRASVEGAEYKGFTLGQLKDELTKFHYFFDVDSKSGAIPSSIVRRAKLTSALESLDPSDPMRSAIFAELMAFDGVDLKNQAQQVGQEAVKEVPSATERLTIDPRQRAQQSAIL
jgi:hypothetical protein